MCPYLTRRGAGDFLPGVWGDNCQVGNFVNQQTTGLTSEAARVIPAKAGIQEAALQQVKIQVSPMGVRLLGSVNILV